VTLEGAHEKLAECRRNIDRIDAQVLALLNERARVVEIIGSVKREHSMPVYEPKREDEVYKNVLDHNHGPLPADAVRRIFERVIDEMRTLQKTRMQS
jgi:chorismate mutase-like protein